MLNEKGENILKNLIALCPSGYKLLSIEDFQEEKNLEKVFSYLEERDFINIKYSDSQNFLVKVLPKGKEYFISKDKSLLLHGMMLRKSAIYSLIGGFLGGFVAGIISFVVGLFYAK